MELQVGFNQGVQQRTVLGPQGALLGQEDGQGLARRGGPGGEGQDELVAGDQGILEGEQAEEQVARGVVTSWHRVGSWLRRGTPGVPRFVWPSGAGGPDNDKEIRPRMES